MPRPTLETVAQVAGVSRATVSRVVRQDVGVSTATVERVRDAIAELGYVPHSAARALASGRATTIAVVVPEPDERVFSDPFFGLAVAGINQELKRSGRQLVMVFAPTRGEPTPTTQFLQAGGIAGAIVMSHHRTDGLAQAVAELPLPSVFLGAPLASRPLPKSVRTVDTDNVAVGRLAAERMLERGIRHPATITGPLDMVASIDRLEGWRTTIARAGLEPTIIEGDFTRDGGRRGAHKILEWHPDTDGVFVASDLMAVAALHEFRDRGVIVGKDIEMVGCDDFEAAAEFGLTTVRNPAVELGQHAALMLLEVIEGNDVESPLILPVSLTIRTSG